MTGTRPPHGLEVKAATLEAPPADLSTTPPDPDTGVTAVDDETGILTAIAAVTGTVDDVSDILVPGCFGRSLCERTPALCVGHDWGRIAGRVLSAVELLPGDPRLPATTGDGSPWPRAAGALLIRARYLLGTREGREQYEIAKAYGSTQAFSIGYRVTSDGASKRGGVRRITDLDLYEVSPVLHGAHRLARQLDVKSATARAVSAVRKARMWQPVDCGVCGGPAGGVTRPLSYGTVVVCGECTSALDDLAVDGGVITRDQLAEAAAIDQADEETSEEAYMAALDGEVTWNLQPDGTLVQADEDPARTGRAWGAASGR